MLRRIVPFLLFACLLPGQTGKPDDVPGFIERMTRQAMRFDGHLPDFICARTTVESIGDGSKWKTQHVIEELAEFAGNNVNARYKLVSLDGRTPKRNQSGFSGHDASLTGLSLVPDWIFSPKASPRFDWRDRETLNGQTVNVFSYTVRPWISMSPLGPVSYTVGFHGLVFASADTADVLRLEMHDDGPSNYPMHDDTIVIDYAWVEISGQRMLLPARTAMQARFGHDKTSVRREATFSGYRKYSADTKIDFGDGVQ